MQPPPRAGPGHLADCSQTAMARLWPASTWGSPVGLSQDALMSAHKTKGVVQGGVPPPHWLHLVTMVGIPGTSTTTLPGPLSKSLTDPQTHIFSCRERWVSEVQNLILV